VDEILKISDLYVEYHTMDGISKAINGVDLTLHRGESLGLVGETGAGKTTLALSILGLLPRRTALVSKGRIEYIGLDLLRKDNWGALQKIRGQKIAMIFQNPLTSLNPVFTIGEQIAMVYTQHQNLSKSAALEKAGEMLETVGIPAYRTQDYPHQFSGGMRQRVGIAAALVCNPDLLIADEPTTALDVTIQAQVLELIGNLKNQHKMSLLMITHNLGIVAGMCEMVAVMYSGKIIEYSTTAKVFGNPAHPYTRGLLNSLPDIKAKKGRLTPIDGTMASPMHLPAGCEFHPRCPWVTGKCRTQKVSMEHVQEGHMVACHNYSSINGKN
jgi:peptide/nickel transport system ATP-binding protein